MDVKSFKKFFGKFSFNETGYYVVKILGGSHNIHYDKLKELTLQLIKDVFGLSIVPYNRINFNSKII